MTTRWTSKIGFAAMVLRLVRLGQELHPDAQGTDGNDGTETIDTARLDSFDEDGPGVGLTPGMSDVLREDDATTSDATDVGRRDKEGQ